MNKRGFTLIELLATIVIIAIVAIIAVPTIGNIISDMSNKVYVESEKTLARTGQNYFLSNSELLPVELGESSFIKLDQLIEVAAAEKIIDPKDQQECEGYLIVSKPTANSYEYDPYIKCGNNYETPLYDLDSAMEPSILILGENPVSLLMGQPYTDVGAKARDKYGNNLTSQIVLNNPVNINVGGVYQVTYTVTDKDGVSKTAIRTVNILDTIPPVITLNAPVPPAFFNMYQDGIFNEPGYTATDNSDGDITLRVQVTHNIAAGLPGNYTAFYNVTDNAGNAATQVTRNVTVVADPAPTVVFGTNGNATWGTSRSTTVTVSDVGSGLNTSSLEYQWTTNTTTPSEASFTTPFANGANITSPAGVSGTYYLWILAKDVNNHTLISRTNVFNLDNGVPTITASNASATWFTSRTSTVTGTDNLGIAEIRYQWNANGMNGTCTTGGTVTTTGTALTVPVGSNSLFMCIRDNAGNTATYTSGADMFRVDSTNPTVTFSMNGNVTWGTSRSTTVTVADAHSGLNTTTLEYQWTTSTTAPIEASFTTAFTNGATITSPAGVSGTYYLWVLAKDNLANTMILSSSVFNLDNAVPTITANNTSTSWFSSRTATVTGTDNMGIAEIRYSWNSNPMSGTCTTGGTVTTTGTALTVPGGTNGLYLCIRDNAGNTATWYSGAGQYLVDGANPTVTFGTNGNSVWGTSRSTTVTVSDTESGVNTATLEYQWTTNTTTPTEASFTTAFTNGASITTPGGATGTYYLWILAKDNSTRTSIISSAVFNIDNTPPTIANIIGGNILFADSNFVSGNNSMTIYNNLGNGTVTHTRTAMTTPVGSYAIRIVTNGTASPGAGGFYQLTGSAANRVYYHKIIARIPVGYTINPAANAVGDGSTFTWLTSQAGTGNWEEYIYVLRTGATGTFNTFGFAYLNGTSNTSVTWDVAYATILDATDVANNTIAFNSTDSNSLINGYGVNQSSTVAPTFTGVTATANLSVQLAPMASAGTYYVWTRDAAGNTRNSSFIIDSTTLYAYRDQFWCYGAVNSATAPSCAGTSIGTQGTDYGGYGSSVLQWDSCTTGGSNYAYGGYAGADIAYTTWPASGYWSRSRNTAYELYADYQHVRCGLSVRYKQSAPWGTYNTAYAETRYTRSYTNRVLWWTAWSSWSTTAVTPTATKEVQTSTSYKFRSS